MQIQSQWT